MSLMDIILLTIVNTVACLVLPKLLSVTFTKKQAPTKTTIQSARESEDATAKITTYADVAS